MKHKLLSILCAAVCVLALGAFSGCNTKNDSGSYTYKEGVDYSKLKTYHIVPFSPGTLNVYPALQTQAGTMYKEIDRLMASHNFAPAAEGKPADFEVRLNFSEGQTNNNNILLQTDPNAVNWVPTSVSVGFLVVDITVQGNVAYRGWSPWGVHMDQFGANTAITMVQWCLQKFPPPYVKPDVPQVVELKQ